MSTEQIKKPRGTIDYFGKEERVLSGLRHVLMEEAFAYGCGECELPMFEENKLFHRTTGESSDIVTKETFDLTKKGDKDYTLRPEFTASVSRAVIESKLYNSPDMPLRISYFGPVFRYERPQAGRLRQFNQYGVEFIDSRLDLDASLDCFMLSIRAASKALDRKVVAKLNYLGSFQSRENYKKALHDFFAGKIDSMCEDCKRRLEINPLRILDCKVPEDQDLCQGAPKIKDYLTAEDKAEYDTLLKTLDLIGVDYQIDDGLVRGLDYYTGLVWELYDSKNENIGAIGGGGKYSTLMSQIGGPDYEGIGFSLGVERLLLSLDEERKEILGPLNPLDYFIIDNRRDGKAVQLADIIRGQGKSANICSFSRGMGGAFKMADRLKAKKVIIVDQDVIQLKDMADRSQIIVNEEELIKAL
ncbi:MAG: histidine--tRNA ligase [Bacilli bacterium]